MRPRHWALAAGSFMAGLWVVALLVGLSMFLASSARADTPGPWEYVGQRPPYTWGADAPGMILEALGCAVQDETDASCVKVVLGPTDQTYPEVWGYGNFPTLALQGGFVPYGWSRTYVPDAGPPPPPPPASAAVMDYSTKSGAYMLVVGCVVALGLGLVAGQQR